MEEKDLFPEVSGFQLPKEAQTVLRSQNVNLTQYQKEINDDIAAGGERKNRRLQHTYLFLDKAMGGTYYSELLEASLPATQREVADSFGNTSGKQNFLGQFWNSSVPALIEGVGKLGAAIPAIWENDDKDWNARNKSVEAFVRPMLTYIDDSFANATPVSWDRNKGEVDFSNLTSGAAWANTTASLLGFMAPVFATAGLGALVRGASAAGKVASGLGALSEVADIAAGGAKLDKVGRAMLGVEFASSTAMMFPEYQKMGVDNGLTIGEATKVALPLAIVNGAIELIGGEALAKGLGFTTADAGKVIREVTRQNADNVLAGLRTGAKLDEAAFQDIVEAVAKNTVHSLADKSQYPLWKRMAARVGRGFKEQGIAEGAEEFLQSSTEELSKVIYNSTVDASLPEGRGRFANFSAGEYATNAMFGTFLGAMMGTGMGMLHKNPKAFDQTLFNYVASDVNSQLANGATDLQSIVPNLKAYGIAQKGMDDGHYDDAEREKINTKIGKMAEVAFEFASSPEIGKSERFAMFRLTQTQNELLDSEAAIAGARQTVSELQQKIQSGQLSPKALIDANAALNEAESQLGAFDPATNTYQAETSLQAKKSAVGNVLQQVGRSMANPANRPVATRFLKNELSVINEEPATNQDFAEDNGMAVVRQAGDGVSRLSRARIVSVEPSALSDDLQFTQDAYTPSIRAQIEPMPFFQTVDEYGVAEAIYTGKQKRPAADLNSLTTSPAADALDVVSLGKDIVTAHRQQQMPEAETPVEEALQPLYDYYRQIQDYDADGKMGVTKYNTFEDFAQALGVVSESTAAEAVEIGVDTQTLMPETQPESLAQLPAEELTVQAAPTNEFYDESLVDEQIAAFAKVNGIEPQVSIPQWVDIAIRRAENALPISPQAIKEASDYLYKLYRQWANMKKATSRIYTIDQIDEMTDLIGQDIELLEQYLNAYEDGTESQFAGRNQAAQTQPDASAAVSAAELGTPNTEPSTTTPNNVNGNPQTNQSADTPTGTSASTIQSEYTQEQERSAAIEAVASYVESAQQSASELEQHTQSLIGSGDIGARLDAAESALRATTQAVQRVTEGLDAVEQTTGGQSSNEDSGAGKSGKAAWEAGSKAVRRKLEKLRRTPHSFLEGVLWYFADGGRVRREDLVRFVGEGTLRSLSGGNSYLSYVADDALPYDKVVSGIVTDRMGYDFVEDHGDEMALTNELFDTLLSFSTLSPQRQLLRLLSQEEQTASQPFTTQQEANEMALYDWGGEALLDKLSDEDREAFVAFLQTLPDNIDLTNPDVLFEALTDYQRNGFPPMSSAAMDLLSVITYDFVFDGQFPAAFQEQFQPLIDQYNNESVQQNDGGPKSTGNKGVGLGTGTNEGNGNPSEPRQSENPSSSAVANPTTPTRTSADGGSKTARRSTLDQRAEQLRKSLADDWEVFVSPGDSLNASLIGITPKQFEAATRMIGNLAELGINRFEDAMLEIIDIIGPDKAAAGFRAFKAAYMAVKANDEETDEDLNALRKTTFEQIQQVYNNVSSTTDNLESDSPRGDVNESLGTADVSSNTGANQTPAGNGGAIAGERGNTFESNSSLPRDVAVTVGSEGDPDLYPSERNDVIAERTTRLGERGRSSELDGDRLSTEPRGERPTLQAAATDNSRAAKIQRQKDAANIEITGSELDNIQATLPYLLSHQHTNVQKAEVRLLEQNEKGILFTDGTGTGKTMTALGIAYRFLRRGKKNILIVTPSDKKVKDWVEEAGYLGITSKGLTGLNDKGQGVSVTTYANFGQNEEIAKRTFDLIIYDESHNLISNESGNSTLAYNKHRDLAKPALDAYYDARREYEETLNEARQKRSNANDNRAKAKFPFVKEDFDKWDAEYAKWSKVIEDIEDNKIPKRTEQLINQTKVVFLSATPFAYHKNIRYADGFLFKAYQQLDSNFKPLSQSDGYNRGDAMDQYMMAAFGYRMRYNKLTEPEAGVDQGLMERNWLESLKASGAVSATKLDIPQDYSREFVLLSEEGQSSPIGLMIDEGLRIIQDNKEFEFLSRAVNKRMDYLYKNRLLEQIKAKLGIERIRKHLEENRKVVIFHTYNEGITSHPFDFSYLGDPEFMEKMGSEITVAAQEARLFNQLYPQYKKIDLRGLTNVPQAIQNAFGEEVVLFNGAIPKAQRAENIKKFNDDNSTVSIIVVNIAAGEAGLNLHDTTGGNQRVLIQLGLPIRPTSAIQSEGRIYRTGQLTNAVFEYFVTHFNFEKYAFGSKINERSGTAENLAMGNEARDLKVSFKEGYLNPIDADPSAEQGVGGKQNDYTRGSMTLMQKAMTYYWARQKKTAKNKSREGVDYFATPEPLGMKMVQWLHLRPGDSALEPSAGHGAIARFFPDSTQNVMVEPSTELRSDLSVNAHGTVIGGTFEQLNIINKFRGIAMNPPFGTAGKTALEHLTKAIRHLENEGRIVAIVPMGSFDGKFEKYFYGKNEKGRYENPEAEAMNLTARILLPSVTFERAGTNVNAQILVLDKQVIATERQKMPQTRTIDLRSIADITAFFERLDGLELAPIVERDGTTQETTQTNPSEAIKSSPITKADSVNNPVKGFHTRNEKDIWVVQTSGKLSSEEYGRIRDISKNHGGYYSSYKDNKGAIPGFIFNTASEASAFYKEITGKEAATPTPVQMMFAPPQTQTANPVPMNGDSSFENTLQLLSQRFEGLASFQTPATEAEFLAKQNEVVPTAKQAAYGFYEPINREVWLNPAVPNANTPIHEIAHPWAIWAKTARPDLYNRGIALVKDSLYKRNLLNDPNYRNLTIEEIDEEALVRAIADQGEQFITPIRKRGFLEWFKELFDSIKEFLGLGQVDADTLANMSLEEFAKRAAADILAGSTQWAEMPTVAGSLNDEAVMKPLFAFGSPTYNFSNNQANITRYAGLQDHIDYALGLLSLSTLNTPSSQWTSQNKREVEAIFARTGVQYTGNGEYKFDLSKSSDTAFLADGTLVRMDRFGQASNQKGVIATTFRNGFLKLYNQDDIYGKIFRFVVDNLRGLMNIETMASLLDDGSGIITSLINDAKRVGGRNKAYVTNILAPKRWKIAQLAKDFTTFDGVNTIHTVKRVEVETYDWDEASQEVVRRRVEIPLATAMSMVLTADTQEGMGATYGGTSLTLPDRFVDQNGDLVDLAQMNPNATPAQIAEMKRQVIFSKAKNVHRGAKLTHAALEKQGNNYTEVQNLTLLLSNRELGKLRNRFVNGIGITSDAETQVFSALKEAFNDKQVRDMIQQEDEQFLNFGTDFATVLDYFPVNSADGQTQINDRVRYRPALEDSKLLNERKGAPKAVYIGDALDTLEDYEYRVGNILEHGRLSHNITTITNALRTEIPDDPMVRQLSQWLLDRRELIEDWRGYKAARRDAFGQSKVFNLVLNRYTSSIFRLNFGMAIKQLATFWSASGQSMLKDEYLYKARNFKEILRLSRGMITDTVMGAGAEVVQGTDVGFKDAMGNDTVQAELLRELLGENIADPAEREMHRRRYATVIERVLYAQNAYVGGVDLDKVTFTSKGLGLMQKLFGRADDWMENIGMAPMRYTDRAVILTYYLASKDQANDEVAGGVIPQAEYEQRVAEILESALYATNQMNKVADMTTMQTSTNWLAKLLGLYSGQTQKLLNVFVQAFINAAQHPNDKEAKTRLRKAFISNVFVVPLHLATVTTVWAALKAIANGDEPKDWEESREDFGWNMLRNIGSIVPGLSEQVVTTVISSIDNEPWNDSLLQYPGDDIVNATVDSMVNIYQWGAAEDDQKAGKYADSFYYNVEKAFSGWTGTPKVVTRFVREHTTTDKDDKKY